MPGRFPGQPVAGLEEAHESELLRSSFFTHHWIAGLRGAADRDADGLVTLGEAFDYAKGLTVRDSHGVRLFSDLVPSALVDSEADRAALLRLEEEASRHPDFSFLGQLGAALHILASRD